MKNKTIKRAKFVNKGKTAEIFIYDDIGEDWYGGISAKAFAEDLKALKDVEQITVYINSYGGSVFEGLTIYQQLVRHPATVAVEIDGIAASIASVIAMAGDTISIAENALFMIHKPTGGAYGTADDLMSVVEALRKIKDAIRDTYVARSGLDADKVTEMIDAETWMSAAEALEHGFVDTVTESKRMAAFVDISKYNYKNAPKELPSAIYTVKPEAPSRKKYADLISMQSQSVNR